MVHSLHELIGDIISHNFPNYHILKDEAVGGDTKRLPMFPSYPKSRDKTYCNVDLLILKNEKIQVIIEIEETDITPNKICGKFLTSALSSYFIHRDFNDDPISMDDSVSFIQILDTSEIKDKSFKIKQGINLESSIRKVLPIKDSKIRKYSLIYGNIFDFKDKNSDQSKKLNKCLEEALK